MRLAFASAVLLSLTTLAPGKVSRTYALGPAGRAHKVEYRAIGGW
jgi:hypothetical protein